MDAAAYWGFKRPRFDDDVLGALDMGRPKYLMRDGRDAIEHLPFADPTSIGASYDRYLQTTQRSSFGFGEPDRQFSKDVTGGIADAQFSTTFSSPVSNRLNRRVPDPIGQFTDVVENQFLDLPSYSSGRIVVPTRPLQLPSSATDTIFVEGLPSDSTEREVAHIFRPFLGYKETRLVPKARMIAFVEFTDASCASTAMNALQGYKLDERKPDSPVLKLQFARPDLKPAHGSRSKK